VKLERRHCAKMVTAFHCDDRNPSTEFVCSKLARLGRRGAPSDRKLFGFKRSNKFCRRMKWLLLLMAGDGGWRAIVGRYNFSVRVLARSDCREQRLKDILALRLLHQAPAAEASDNDTKATANNGPG
jgi:hypothetical protein